MLLLVKLRELARKKQAFLHGIAPHAAADAVLVITIEVREFIEAARVHGITEIDEFLRSDLFARSGFRYEADAQLISRTF